MIPTFYGLELARKAVTASQVALNVTGQNISNVNTDDYTRQRADLVAVNISGSKYRLSQVSTANVGQGVDVSKISQVRDDFLDAKARSANSEYNTRNSTLTALQDIQNVLDETNNDGLSVMLGDFYNQLQSLSNHAGEVEFSNIARSAAEKVTQTLNQYASQLSQIRDQQVSDLGITVDQVNVTVAKLNAVNNLIKDQAVRGNISNELLDQRNGYLDTLSNYMSITVSANLNGNGQPDGSISVTATGGVDVLHSVFAVTDDGTAAGVTVSTNGGDPVAFAPDQGSIKAKLQVINGKGAYGSGGEFQGIAFYQQSLDDFAEAFSGTFNSLNTLDPSDPKPLFQGVTASTITLSSQWRADANYIVVKDKSSNDNVIRMINAMDQNIDTAKYPNMSGTFEGYSRMLMNSIYVDTNYQKDMKDMSENILDSVLDQRESIMGVNIDEETVNMTKYQKSFEAAARLMTVMDSVLDTIINGMGVH